MLNRLVQFALTQRLFVLLAAVLLAGFGWYAFRSLPIDAFPDVSSTQVKIIMKAPGMTPEEIESRIAVPIEVEMLGIPKQRILRSVTKYGLVDVTVDFQDGTDIYWARQQVAERLNNIVGDLPSGITGGMAPITTPLGEMFMFTVEGAAADAGGTAQPARLGHPPRAARGARRGRCQCAGRQGAQLRGAARPGEAAGAGPVTAQIKTAIEANNRNDGAGRLGEGGEVLLVRTEGSIKTQDDLRAVVVARKDGSRRAPRRRGHRARRQHHALRRRHHGRQGRGRAGPGAGPGRRQRAAGGAGRKGQDRRTAAYAAGRRDAEGLLRPRLAGREGRGHGLARPCWRRR